MSDVQGELNTLAARDEPLVARLDRQPGRKEARYAQLLVAQQQAPDPALTPEPAAATTDSVGLLRAKVAEMRAEVARLAALVDGT